MSFSLYAATIPTFQQILGAISGLLDKAEAFCAEKGIAAQELGWDPGRQLSEIARVRASYPFASPASQESEAG